MQVLTTKVKIWVPTVFSALACGGLALAGYIRAAMSVAALGLIVILCMGCPMFRQVLIRSAVECGPALISEVARILLTEGWRDGLQAKAGAVGMDAIKCAVRANLKDTGIIVTGPHEAEGVVRRVTVSPQAVIRVRAALWLSEHP